MGAINMNHALADGRGFNFDLQAMIEQARTQEVWGFECPYHGFRRFQDRCEVCDVERKRAESVLQHNLAEAGAPQRFAGLRLEAFAADTEAHAEALAAVRAVLSGEIVGAVLAGPTGVGKTLAASAAAHEWVDGMLAGQHKGRAKYTTGRLLIDTVRATYKSSSEQSEEEVLREFTRAGLLVLDELGEGRLSEDEQYQLSGVINARHEQQRPTILCTNWPLADLHRPPQDRRERSPRVSPLDDRALSRIYAGDWRRVEITGDDRRVSGE